MAKVVAFDKFHNVTENHGNYYVRAEWDNGEHHMTNRADALRYLRSVMGEDWDIRCFVGLRHYRRFDGHPATAREYAVVRIG